MGREPGRGLSLTIAGLLWGGPPHLPSPLPSPPPALPRRLSCADIHLACVLSAAKKIHPPVFTSNFQKTVKRLGKEAGQKPKTPKPSHHSFYSTYSHE